MQRPPRPEPTRISSYFFEQLQPVRHDDDDVGNGAKAKDHTAAAVEAAETATPSPPCVVTPPVAYLKSLFETGPEGPHRDGAGEPAPIFSAPPQPQQQRDLQQVLWTSFTPAPYTENFSTFLTDESGITERLRGAVAEAWESVESVIQRNNDRRARLTALTEETAAWRDEVRSKLYWQSSDIVSRYGLEVGGPATADGASTAAAAAQQPHHNGAADEHILLDFSVLQEDPQEGTAAATAAITPHRTAQDADQDDDSDGVDGESDGASAAPTVDAAVHVTATAPQLQRAKAWTTDTKDLLDPCARPHPLRRIFAPLQRERDTFPKWTTLLLRDVREVQQTKLPDLEARLRSSVLFKVPLHRPFLEARAVLQACATQHRAAPAVEAGQVAAYRQVEQFARRLTAFLHEQRPTAVTPDGRDAAKNVEEDLITDTGERWATAETLWTMLLTELDACKRFLADAVPRCTTLHDTVMAEKAVAQRTLEERRAACEATLTRMKAEARTCSELLTRNGRRTLAAVAEMEEKFAPDQARLQAAIARRQAELTQLAALQEKNVRRVREALKACFVDQMKYEEAAQALLQDQVSLAQLETSHQQLRRAVQVRHEGVVECEKHAVLLAQLLEDADTVAHSLFSVSEAHQRRMADEDYFVQCRLVDQCTLTLQQRCRCLHAMAALYDQRYATLEQRAGGSWQLQFLLAGERDWAVANLADVRAEFALLERDWETVRDMRAAMDMEPAALDVLVHTAEWATLRATLLRLDAPPPLQRQLPTLRAHAEAVAHPAAGCGSQAVRRLLTS
ncbi:hypothetical protein ABB37_09622 [Leptomonas pyrrhocoris]|uniref:Uncharacterized protein n=1 Tax=Leptomonas pyrrhocoris TaxID=157538 RepID=A0A0M9FQA6_LEPPY|nr:hypothetical protein ABB37_09622 [Leptomonas pyrrhocoris]KPA73696.1 hypothetical protein ABB37_09622 [Leptomonas pyrrhocoris]|eukprot:XP_015652135.1 hypothetical protein ABB37_09622 [Leptomonas pyrrhocoris]